MQRIFAILHLCLLCSLIFIGIGAPFLGEHYAIHSRLRLYSFIEQCQAEHAIPLPPETATRLALDKRILQEHASTTLWKKCTKAFHTLLVAIPLWIWLWFLFSWIIAWSLLKERDYGLVPLLLLPLLLLSPLFFGFPTTNPWPWVEERSLFPPEETLFREYGEGDWPRSWNEQKRVLKKCWENYLISVWGNAMPPLAERERQILMGNFFFHLARLEKGSPLALPSLFRASALSLAPWFWGLLLLWQLAFTLGQIQAKGRGLHLRQSRALQQS